MANREERIKIILKKLRHDLEEEIDVEELWLFGSHAYGKPRKNSDIDVAVISKSFEKMDDIQRLVLLSSISRKIPLSKGMDIDLVGFTKKELKNAGYFDLAGEIRDKGKKVA